MPPGRRSYVSKVAGYPGGPQNRSSCRGSANADQRRSTGTGKSPTSVIVRASGSVVTDVTGMTFSFFLRGLFRFGEQRVETVDASSPEGGVGVELLLRSRDGRGIGADEPLPPAVLLGHESGSFQHGDVLLHRRERHRVRGREAADRRVADQGAAQDVSSGRIRERVKDAVDLRVIDFDIYNHLVVRYITVAGVSK